MDYLDKERFEHEYYVESITGEPEIIYLVVANQREVVFSTNDKNEAYTEFQRNIALIENGDSDDEVIELGEMNWCDYEERAFNYKKFNPEESHTA